MSTIFEHDPESGELHIEITFWDKRDVLALGAIICGAAIGVTNVPALEAVGAAVMTSGAIYEGINLRRGFQEARRFRTMVNEWREHHGSTATS